MPVALSLEISLLLELALDSPSFGDGVDVSALVRVGVMGLTFGLFDHTVYMCRCACMFIFVTPPPFLFSSLSLLFFLLLWVVFHSSTILHKWLLILAIQDPLWEVHILDL